MNLPDLESRVPTIRLSTLDSRPWTLEPAGTPLEKLVEPIRYTLQVKDADGLELDRPIEGGISIYVDQLPQIFASARVQLVVPKGRPTIQFQAADDYGLAQIKVLCEVTHADGTPGERGEVSVYTLSPDEPPRKNIQDSYRLALAPLERSRGTRSRSSSRRWTIAAAHVGRI